MLVALLAVLGVDLIVIAALVAALITRRRWVANQPGAFKGSIRTTNGTITGLRPKWTPGYGRWVHDVLVWTKAPLLLRNEFVASDGAEAERPAQRDEVKRLGGAPIVLRLRTAEGTAEVAAEGQHRDLLVGPYGSPAHQAHVDT